MHGVNLLEGTKSRISLHILAASQEGRVNKVKLSVMRKKRTLKHTSV